MKMSTSERERALSNLCKKRGTVKGSLTKLGRRVQELEDDPGREGITEAATLLIEKVSSLQKDFKTHHDNIIDLINPEEEDDLERESDVLYRQDELNDGLVLRLRRLLSKKEDKAPEELKAIERRLKQLCMKPRALYLALTIDQNIYPSFNSMLKSSSLAMKN